MSRIDPAACRTHTPVAESPDPKAEAPGSVPAPASRTAAASNRLEAFIAPARFAGPPEAADPETTYAEVQQLLSRSLTDWAVTDAELVKVHGLLGRLAPGHYSDALGRLDRDGLLDRYFSQMSNGARQAFLQQAERQGAISSEPGQKAPRTAGAPPDGPALFRLDPAMPESLRKCVHSENKRAVFQYEQEYRGYLERYKEQVLAATSGLQLLALGEPVDRLHHLEPRQLEHPENRELERDWRDPSQFLSKHDLRNSAYQAVMNKMHDLTGQQRPGTFWFKLKGEIELFGLLRSSGEVKLTDYGAVKENNSLGLSLQAAQELPGLPPVPGEKAQGGALYYERTLDQNGQLTEAVGAQLLGVGLRLDDQGSARTSIEVGGGAVYSDLNAHQGTLEQGFKLGTPLGSPLKVSLGAGLGFQGARGGNAKYIMSEPHLFAAVAALHEGKRWEELPELLQGQLQRAGIRKEQWEQERNQGQRSVRASP